MTELRRPKGAVSLGDAVPCVHQAPATIARYCACGTKLRRGNPGPLCSTCHTRQHPWVMPEPRTEHAFTRRGELYRQYNSTKCGCGAPKAAGAKRCKACHLRHIANPNPWHGRVCPECAGPKAIGARMCFTCRYHTKSVA